MEVTSSIMRRNLAVGAAILFLVLAWLGSEPAALLGQVHGQNRQGAVEADSTPPASTTPGSDRTREAATATAARPLPHCRSTVSAGTAAGRPAASAATRATSPPGPMQLPSTTSPSSATGSPVGSSPSASATSTGAARSTAVSAASDRPAVPIGVRRASTMTGRLSWAGAVAEVMAGQR